MADPSSEKVEPYGLSVEFERALALASSSRPALYGLLVSRMVPSAVRDPTAQLVLRAVQAIGKEMHRGPTSFAVVAQRLHRWMDEGRVTQEELDAVGDLVLESAEPPTNDELCNELAPILRLRIQKEAVKEGIAAYQRREDFELVERKIQEARRVGVHDASTGLRLGGSLRENVSALAVGGRLGFGVMDLDLALGGGPPARTLTLFIAPTGGGKSMALIQQAAHGLQEGHLVAYATLELPAAFIEARIISNVLDLPTNGLLDMSLMDMAEQEFALHAPSLGQLVIQEFPGGATYVSDLRDWVREIEQEEGRRLSVLCVDYIDEMASERKDDRDDYSRQGTIAAGLSLFAKEHGHWSFTASQAKRRNPQDRKRRVYTDDVSDSLKKVQKSDVVIGISTPDDDALLVEFNIAKNRFGQKDVAVGPLPHNYAHGQIVAREAK